MPATDEKTSNEKERSRAEQEYQFLATLLRSPEKLPLVIKRLDPARFDVPIVAQIVKAIAESYAADERLSLDDLRSRLTPQENAEVDTVMAYSAVMADDAEILAVLDRSEGTAGVEGPPRSGPIHGSTVGPPRMARTTRTNVRGSHPSPSSQSSREEIERRVIASLVRTLLPRHIVRLEPNRFEVPAFACIADAMLKRYRMLPFVTMRDLKSELSEEEQKLVDDFKENGPFLPHDVDPIAVLAGEQPLPPAETKTCSPQAQPCCAPLTQFEAEPRRWLWPERMELGQLTLVGGEASSGKSLVACDLAARTTTGGPWPDGAGASTPGSVLLVAAAHDVSRLMRPRLEAAGADIERIHVLNANGATPARRDDRDSPFQAMLKAIEGALEQLVDCRLVVIDPLRLSIGRTATTVEGDPKARLESLASLARRQQVTVLGVVRAVCDDRRHDSQADALKLATGGCDATAWHVARHPHLTQVRLFLPIKTTRSSDLEALRFKVVDEAAGERVQWDDQAAAGEISELTPGEDAARWLQQALADGRLPSKELFDLGARNGYTPRMLHKAKPLAGVTVIKEGFQSGAAWHWVLAAASHSCQAKSA
jgi:putative DNA primase/helicase